MTVRELINDLLVYSPDAEVMFSNSDRGLEMTWEDEYTYFNNATQTHTVHNYYRLRMLFL